MEAQAEEVNCKRDSRGSFGILRKNLTIIKTKRMKAELEKLKHVDNLDQCPMCALPGKSYVTISTY